MTLSRSRPRGRVALVHGWLCCLLLSLAACASQPQPAAPARSHHMAITGPTIVAFLPPDAQVPGMEGAAEARAHVQFALSDTRRCMGGKPVRIETVFADTLVLRDGGRSETLALADLGQGIGAVVVEPGRPAAVVYVTVGASSLPYQLPQAVYDYWKLKDCRRD